MSYLRILHTKTMILLLAITANIHSGSLTAHKITENLAKTVPRIENEAAITRQKSMGSAILT
jgi:hypothetical protein